MGINVRGIVRSGVNSINPDTPVVILQSSGFTVLPGGIQAPGYLPAVSAIAQVQPIPSEELKHIANFNSSSVYYDLYIDGDWHGLNRADEKGGDLIYFDGFEWLVISRPEAFSLSSNWTKVRVVQQKTAAAPVVP